MTVKQDRAAEGAVMTNQQRAKAIVEAIRKDFTDRRGLRQEWDAIGDDVKREIVETWRALVIAELKKP